MPWVFAHSRTSVEFGPLADPLRPLRAGRWAPTPARRAAPHIAGQRISQRLGMIRAQVDLILGAVQPEADVTFSVTAVKVIDEQGLYLLGHGNSIPLTDLIHQHGQSKPDDRTAAPNVRIAQACTKARPG
jgi:hypothetical protein